MKQSLLLYLVAAAAIACASRSRLAPTVDVPDSATVTGSMVVPYPPPPAKVETMPPAPIERSCVYLDGQWVFGARDWQWHSGAWVIAPPGCAFARSQLFWQTAGVDRSELRFRPGHWANAQNTAVDCPVATPCPGSTPNTP